MYRHSTDYVRSHGVCACVCKGRLTSDIFLSHSSSYFGCHGFSLNLKLAVLARLAGQDPGSTSIYSSSAGVTGACCHTQLLCGCWVSKLRSSWFGSKHYPLSYLNSPFTSLFDKGFHILSWLVWNLICSPDWHRNSVMLLPQSPAC